MCDCCDPTSPSPDPVVVRLEKELEEAKIEIETLKAEDPAKYAWMHACDDLAKECVELKAELSTMRGLLREIIKGNWTITGVQEVLGDLNALEGKP